MHPRIQLPSPCQQRVAFWTSLASETPVLHSDNFELYSLAHNNAPRSHLQCTVTRRERKSSSFDLNRFNNVLYTDALVAICSSLRDFGTQRAVSLCIPKRSCKVVKMLPCEKSNAFAISSTLIRLSEYTRSCTLLHISSSVASDGRPDLVSSSKDVLLRLNSPNQNLTCIRWCRRPINIGQLAMYFLTCFPFQIQVPNYSTVLNFWRKAYFCIAGHVWHSISYEWMTR